MAIKRLLKNSFVISMNMAIQKRDRQKEKNGLLLFLVDSNCKTS